MVVVCGGALATIASPAPPYVVPLLLGALWGVAYMLYAIVAADRPLGFLGGGIVALAVICRIVVPDTSLLIFGIVAGASIALFGGIRMRNQWQ